MFKNSPDRAATIVQDNFTKMGFTVSKVAIVNMLGKLDANPAYVPGLEDYLTAESKLLIEKKQIAQMPDWKALLSKPLLQQIARN